MRKSALILLRQRPIAASIAAARDDAESEVPALEIGSVARLWTDLKSNAGTRLGYVPRVASASPVLTAALNASSPKDRGG
jgi:hypothetical protein